MAVRELKTMSIASSVTFSVALATLILSVLTQTVGLVPLAGLITLASGVVFSALLVELDP